MNKPARIKIIEKLTEMKAFAKVFNTNAESCKRGSVAMRRSNKEFEALLKANR